MRGKILILSAAALLGCEESTTVGSGCENGACPEALVRDDDVCVVVNGTAEILVSTDPTLPVPVTVDGHCLSRPLVRGDDSLVQAKVYYQIPTQATPRITCTDKPFLKPVSEHVRDKYVIGTADVVLCELNQLAVVSTDGGEPIVAAGEGFYYDDSSDSLDDACTGSPKQRLMLTEDAQPWNGVAVFFVTAETRNADGEIDDTLSCEPLRGSEPVGAPCASPQTEFSDNQVVIATRSDDCGQGVCMTFRLDGRTDVGCTDVDGPDGSVSTIGDPECASPDEIAERMYCTCRCDGPPNATDLCECPDGFSCVNAIGPELPSVEGSYCVKNGRVD